MSFGEGSDTAFQTMRGRNFPAIRQFTIFLENRVGQLLEVLKRFEGTGIRVVALSINDAAECAFVRFLVSDADRGRGRTGRRICCQFSGVIDIIDAASAAGVDRHCTRFSRRGRSRDTDSLGSYGHAD